MIELVGYALMSIFGLFGFFYFMATVWAILHPRVSVSNSVLLLRVTVVTVLGLAVFLIGAGLNLWGLS